MLSVLYVNIVLIKIAFYISKIYKHKNIIHAFEVKNNNISKIFIT